MNERTIVLTRYRDSILYMSMDDKRPLEYQIFGRDADEAVGNIYVCMVKDIVKNIGASFVMYGDNKTGFIKTTSYKRGSFVPMQLKKMGAVTRE